VYALDKEGRIVPLVKRDFLYNNEMNKIVIALCGNASIQWDVKGI
jgi:hypothetical protein